MGDMNGSTKKINVQCSNEHRINYLARRFRSGLDAPALYYNLIGLETTELPWLNHSWLCAEH